MLVNTTSTATKTSNKNNCPSGDFCFDHPIERSFKIKLVTQDDINLTLECCFDVALLLKCFLHTRFMLNAAFIWGVATGTLGEDGG